MLLEAQGAGSVLKDSRLDLIKVWVSSHTVQLFRSKRQRIKLACLWGVVLVPPQNNTLTGVHTVHTLSQIHWKFIPFGVDSARRVFFETTSTQNRLSQCMNIPNSMVPLICKLL